jgi:hypothetical protein
MAREQAKLALAAGEGEIDEGRIARLRELAS